MAIKIFNPENAMQKFKHLARQTYKLLKSPSVCLAERFEWQKRIEEVLRCPDNSEIPRHKNAGSIVENFQTMHNGLEVVVDGYYGSGITEMLKRNRGCHEPQEELVFQSLLPRLGNEAVMIELGAYWGFYSMWFLKGNPRRRAWLIEPSPDNLLIGMKNLHRNRLVANCVVAGVASVNRQSREFPAITVDELLTSNQLAMLDVLHADIQGAELEMLEGAKQSLERRRIQFMFISTHSESLHRDCINCILCHGYHLHTDISPSGSYSLDGIIVATADKPPDYLPLPSVKTAI